VNDAGYVMYVKLTRVQNKNSILKYNGMTQIYLGPNDKNAFEKGNILIQWRLLNVITENFIIWIMYVFKLTCPRPLCVIMCCIKKICLLWSTLWLLLSVCFKKHKNG
jgi:hypothetical protein